MVFTNRQIEREIWDRMADGLAQLLASQRSHGSSDSGAQGLMPLYDDVVHGAMPSYKNVHMETEPYQRNLPDDWISIHPNLLSSQVGIVGFDLRVGKLMAKSDIVMDHVTENDLLDMKPRTLGEDEDYILLPNADGENVYYYTTLERVTGSESLELILDSKSTSARLGMLTHQVGYTNTGELILCVQPFSFPIKLKSGKSTLAQAVIRFKDSPYITNGDILTSPDIKFEDETGLAKLLTSNGLLMRFVTKIAYRARKYSENMAPIEVDAKPGSLTGNDYYELIDGNSQILADKKTLYLLGSYGVIDLGSVCGLLTREHGVLTGTGAWSHMAGIIQPFWRGGITMEFYSHEKRRVCDKSGAGFLKFDKIQGECKKPETPGSYQDQVPPKLPKMFAQE